MSDGTPEEEPVCPDCEGTGVVDYETEPGMGENWGPCGCEHEPPEARG